MIPDCRKDKYYNYDFLPEENKEFVDGMDFALRVTKILLEDNLEVYKYLMPTELYEMLKKHGERLVEVIKTWHETERNMVIVSMIESIDDDDYVVLREEAIKRNFAKEYYDSLKHGTAGRGRKWLIEDDE